MDPERHEEFEDRDDVAHALATGKAFWERWGNTICVAVLLATGAWAITHFINTSRQTRHEESWREYESSTSPKVLRELAETQTNPTLRAIEYLGAADILLKESVMMPKTTPNGDAAPMTKINRDGNLADAQRMYQAVIDDAQAPLVYRLNALLGLASVAETLGHFDAAMQHYERVQKLGGDEHTALVGMATARANMLESIRDPVAFAPEKVVEPTSGIEGPGELSLDPIPGFDAQPKKDDNADEVPDPLEGIMP